MCWSWEVSLFFSVIESLCISFIIWIIIKFPSIYKKKHMKDLPYYTKLHRYRIIWSLPFIITINLVEWSEVGIWLSNPLPISELISSQSDACRSCSSGNFYFTTLAGFAIGFQPLFTVLFLNKTHNQSKFHLVLNKKDILGLNNEQVSNTNNNYFNREDEEENNSLNNTLYNNNNNNNNENYFKEMQSLKEPMLEYLENTVEQDKIFKNSRDTFKIMYFMGWTVTILSFFFWVLLTLFPSIPKCTYDDSKFSSMAAACTCSYIGKSGHLAWTFMFPCKLHEFLPTIFDYIMLANIAPFFYGPCWMAMPMIGSFLFFIAELIYYMGSTEVFSVWCWTGVGAIGLELTYALMLYDDNILQKLESTGLNGSCIEVGYMFIKASIYALCNFISK